MSIGADDYREAGGCRLEDAWRLFEGERWEGAIYLAGRAAEAMLRSLLVRRGAQLEVGHNLRDHLKRVRELGVLRASNDEGLEDAINELAVVWRNDLRFTGPKRFLRVLKDAGRLYRIGNRKIKGQPGKVNARSLLNAAEQVVSRGSIVWKRLSKN